MLVNLKEFQQKAVRNLIDKCSELLDQTSKQRICVFCSPTGSGKTTALYAFLRETHVEGVKIITIETIALR